MVQFWSAGSPQTPNTSTQVKGGLVEGYMTIFTLGIVVHNWSVKLDFFSFKCIYMF